MKKMLMTLMLALCLAQVVMANVRVLKENGTTSMSILMELKGTSTTLECDQIKSGSVEWDGDAKKLTLDHARIEGLVFEFYAADASDTSTTLELVGQNEIVDSQDVFLLAEGTRLKVQGQGYEGSLNVTTQRRVFWYEKSSGTETGTLEFSNCEVNAKGGTYAVDGNNRHLDMKASWAQLTFEAGTQALFNLNNLTMADCCFHEPEEAASFSSGEIKDIKGRTLTPKKVRIDFVIEYPIEVAGITVNAANRHDVLGDHTVSYRDDTHTLTLNEADNYMGKSHGIVFYDEEGTYNINLQGRSYLSRSSNHGLYSCGADIVLCGDGELSLKGYSGLCSEGGNITLKNSASLYLDGANQDGHRLQLGGGKLAVLDEAYLFAHGYGKSVTMDGIGGLELGSSRYVDLKSGAYYDETKQTFISYSEGKPSTDIVVIGELQNYDLWIADEPITSINADDVLGDGSVWVTYNQGYVLDDGRFTIHMKDAYLQSTKNDQNAMIRSKNDVRLICEGTNTIESIKVGSDAWAIYCEEDCEIQTTESGSLHIISPSQGIYGSNVDLRGNIKLTSDGKGYYNGIVGEYGLYIGPYYSEDPYEVEIEGGIHSTVTGFVEFRTSGIVENHNGIMLDLCCEEVDGYLALRTGLDKHILKETLRCTNGSAPALYFSGERISLWNKEDVLADGKVSYDDATHTLTVDGEDQADFYILNVDDLTIQMKGENKYEAIGSCIEIHNSKVRMVGDGNVFKINNLCREHHATPASIYVISDNGSETVFTLENMNIESEILAAPDRKDGSFLLAAAWSYSGPIGSAKVRMINCNIDHTATDSLDPVFRLDQPIDFIGCELRGPNYEFDEENYTYSNPGGPCRYFAQIRPVEKAPRTMEYVKTLEAMLLGNEPVTPQADINLDGKVSVADIVALIKEIEAAK